jgi:hypothetical protein
VVNRGNGAPTPSPDGHVVLVSSWQGELEPSASHQTIAVPIATKLDLAFVDDLANPTLDHAFGPGFVADDLSGERIGSIKPSRRAGQLTPWSAAEPLARTFAVA